MATVIVKLAILIAGLVVVCRVIRAYVKGDGNMAKLEGVKIIEIKDGAVTKIEYNGEEYEYVEGDVRASGNIVQNVSETEDADIGAFYSTNYLGEVEDNIGERHANINLMGRTFVKKRKDLAKRVDDLEERVGNLEAGDKVRKPVEGDIVVITDNTNNSANKVGDIGIVTGIKGPLGSPCVKVPGRSHGLGKNHTKYGDMRLATADERAEYFRNVKAHDIEVGDFVRVTGETFYGRIPKGTIVKVVGEADHDGHYRIQKMGGSKQCDYDWAGLESLEKVDVGERELSFLRAGRDIDVHKQGDIVRVEDACSSPLVEGGFYEIGDNFGYIYDNGHWLAHTTLITPVEKRTDIE